MSRLGYSVIASLDGYVNDESGGFEWAAPDPEVHAFANQLERGIGTHLLGRKMYEVMAFWETALADPDLPDVEREYAEFWQDADKIVYSSTLAAPTTARTRLEREFDPDEVRRLKATTDRDISIGGPELAGAAIRSGLVDDIHVFLIPVIIGGGQYFLPAGERLDLELVNQRRFTGQTVYLHYRVKSQVEDRVQERG